MLLNTTSRASVNKHQGLWTEGLLAGPSFLPVCFPNFPRCAPAWRWRSLTGYGRLPGYNDDPADDVGEEVREIWWGEDGNPVVLPT